MVVRVKRFIFASALIVLSGCSTRPREFDARLAAAPADEQTYIRDFATCRLLVRSNFQKNTAQQAAAVIAGYPTVFVGGFIAAKMIKNDREKRQNAQMSECMQEYGYKVVGWERVGKKNRSQVPAPPVAMARTEPAPVQPLTVKEPDQ